MIRSMTGFASLTREGETATIGVTIRSVNHRDLDIQTRIPHTLADLEPRVRALVQRHLARGRVELSVVAQPRQAPGIDIELNEEFVRALGAALDTARARGLISGALAPGDLLRLPQAIVIRERLETDPAIAGELGQAVEKAIEEAVVQLDSMRVRDGGQLTADLEARRTGLAALIERIAAAADEGRVDLEKRLAERVRELTADIQADKTAVAQEIVRTAARSDISEEVVRFRAHLAQWAALAEGPEPCGRKLDFLLQEMNREVNTIGSKADGVNVSELIVVTKAELEKMREQVQNVE